MVALHCRCVWADVPASRRIVLERNWLQDGYCQGRRVVLPLKCLVYLQTRSLILNRRLAEFSIRLLCTSLRRHKESRCWGYNKFSRCPSLLVNVRHHGSNGIYSWMQRSPLRNLTCWYGTNRAHATKLALPVIIPLRTYTLNPVLTNFPVGEIFMGFV
jgi:hypothetical protein